MMISAFNSNDMSLGILFAISAALWTVTSLYNAFFFVAARREYANLGGIRQAGKELGKQAATTAYENRGAIKQVAIDNKDAIRQVVIDNKDTIRQVVVDNKDDIVDFVKENRGTISQVAYENKDTLFENRDVVASVFDDHTGTPHPHS